MSTRTVSYQHVPLYRGNPYPCRTWRRAVSCVATYHVAPHRSVPPRRGTSIGPTRRTHRRVLADDQSWGWHVRSKKPSGRAFHVSMKTSSCNLDRRHKPNSCCSGTKMLSAVRSVLATSPVQHSLRATIVHQRSRNNKHLVPRGLSVCTAPRHMYGTVALLTWARAYESLVDMCSAAQTPAMPRMPLSTLPRTSMRQERILATREARVPCISITGWAM